MYGVIGLAPCAAIPATFGTASSNLAHPKNKSAPIGWSARPSLTQRAARAKWDATDDRHNAKHVAIPNIVPVEVGITISAQTGTASFTGTH
jgi:hypothetical protein